MGNEEKPAQAPSRVKRRLAAILAADAKGYSRLMGADEVATLHTLTAYREVTDALISQHQGRIVSTAGDSILAEFASVVDAVQCAVEIQRALKARNAELPEHRRMEFRIGINLGDVMVEGEQQVKNIAEPVRVWRIQAGKSDSPMERLCSTPCAGRG